MTFLPSPGLTITIDKRVFRVAEHPLAPGMGMSYGQEGRRAVVYQLLAESGDKYALKVFKARFRIPRMVAVSETLEPYASLEGMQACRRTVLTASRHRELLSEHPELAYAVLMPWVDGQTWQEILLSDEPVSSERSLKRAQSSADLLVRLEERGLAHCDLSGPNLIIQPGDRPGLVDLEEMYGPGFQEPKEIPAGSPGYAHKSAPRGIWSDEADRFAGAVLLTEMLCWHDPAVREAAWGESYFAPKDMQTENQRLDVLRGSLETYYSSRILDLFNQAWRSDSLRDCPTFAEWAVAIPDKIAFVEKGDLAQKPQEEELEDPQTLVACAEMLEGDGEYGQAVELYREAIAKSPSDLSREIEQRIEVLERNLRESPAAPESLTKKREYPSRFCQDCGEKIPEGQKICPSCEGTSRKTKEKKSETRQKRPGKIIVWIGGGLILLFGMIYIFLGRIGDGPFSSLTEDTPSHTLTTLPTDTKTSAPTKSASNTPAPSVTPIPSPTANPLAVDPYLGPVPEDALIRIGRGSILDQDLSPDKSKIALGSSLGVWIYNIKSYTYELYFEEETPIFNIAWSPDSTLLAGASGSNSLIIWSADSGTVLKELETTSGIDQLEWSGDGKYLAVADRLTVEIIDTITWQKRKTIYLSDADFSSWTLEGKPITQLQNKINSIAWLNDNRLAVSYGYSGFHQNYLIVWNPLEGYIIKSFFEERDPANSIAISSDGEYMASGSVDGLIYLYNPRTLTHLSAIRTSNLAITALDWSPDSELLVSGSVNGEVSIWDPVTREIINSMTDKIWVEDVNWLSTGKILVGYTDGTSVVWSTESGDYTSILEAHQTYPTRKRNSSTTSGVVWSPDGNYVAQWKKGGSVNLWETEQWTLSHNLDSQVWNVTTAAWSPDGKILICGTGGYPGALVLWDTEIEDVKLTLRGYWVGINSVVTDSTENRIAFTGERNTEITIWNLENQVELMRIRLSSALKDYYDLQIDSVSFSPDGSLIAGIRKRQVEIWKANNGAHLRHLISYHGYVYDYDWSPGGDKVAGAIDDGTLIIWNATSGEHFITIEDKTNGSIYSIEYSPDGTVLATGAETGIVTLWNPVTGEMLTELRGHVGTVFDLAWSPQGETLVSASTDGTLLVWDIREILQ